MKAILCLFALIYIAKENWKFGFMILLTNKISGLLPNRGKGGMSPKGHGS